VSLIVSATIDERSPASKTKIKKKTRSQKIIEVGLNILNNLPINNEILTR
jgi:hypothetical protein